MDDPRVTLTTEQLDALGQELDALRKRVMDDLGEADVTYIRNLIKAQRALEFLGPGSAVRELPAARLAGRRGRPLAVEDPRQHGDRPQRDARPIRLDRGTPTLSSGTFEWDTACPADQWRHSHNYIHHTYTNILGKDRDIGYGVLRMSDQEPWRPRWLGNPLYALALAVFFQYGVALHDLEIENLGKREAERPRRELARGIWKKVRSQTLKDYVLFPAALRAAVPARAGR